MLGSCLCCLPKPESDLCATGHLAQESQLPAAPCPSPAIHHALERCRKIWLPRASSAEACPNPGLASACSQGLGQPCTSSCCHSPPQQMPVAAGCCGVAALASSQQLRYLPLLEKPQVSCSGCWAVPAHFSLPFVFTTHADLEWNDPQVSTYLFAQSFSSASLSEIRQHLLLLTIAGNDENLPLPPLLCSPSVFFPQKCHVPQVFNPFLHMHYLWTALGTLNMKGGVLTKLPKGGQSRLWLCDTLRSFSSCHLARCYRDIQASSITVTKQF